MVRLNAKQQRFVSEYIIDLNATQAAIRAGYSPRTAKSQGSRLLTNADIQEAIKRRKEELAAECNVSAKKVIEEYTRVAFFDPRRCFDDAGNIIPANKLPADVAAALSSMDYQIMLTPEGSETSFATLKVRFHNKLKALEDLGKHLGLFDKNNGQKKQEGSTVNNWISCPGGEMTIAEWERQYREAELADEMNFASKGVDRYGQFSGDGIKD